MSRTDFTLTCSRDMAERMQQARAFLKDRDGKRYSSRSLNDTAVREFLKRRRGKLPAEVLEGIS